jgi:hypothetical protein
MPNLPKPAAFLGGVLVVMAGIAAWGFIANALRDNSTIKQIIAGYDY